MKRGKKAALWAVWGFVLLVGTASAQPANEFERKLIQANQLRAKARYAEAEVLYKAAVEDSLQFREDDSRRGKALNNLAALYHTIGKLDEAAPGYRQALELFQRTLGDESAEVASTSNNLGEIERSLGRYAEAEKLYQRALSIRETLLRKAATDAASTLNSLAVSGGAQGEYDRANLRHEQALALNKQFHGESSLPVSVTLNNMAELRRLRKQYAEAGDLYARSLEIRETVLGREHPDVAVVLNNLAALRQDEGKLDEAEPLYRRALEIRERVFGEGNGFTGNSWNNLAGLLRQKGDLGGAREAYGKAVGHWEKGAPGGNPQFAMVLGNYGEFLSSIDAMEEAEPLVRRALAMAEEHLGAQHPETTRCLSVLATLHLRQGKGRSAEQLFARALQSANSTEQQPLAEGLSTAYRMQGRTTEAEQIRKKFGLGLK